MNYKPGTFEYIEAKIRSDVEGPEDKSYGQQFEKLCKYFLLTSPVYKTVLKSVWLWNEWPDRWRDKECGIDLVAKTYGGDYWAIQAKCYKPEYPITKKDVDKFLSWSNRTIFSYRLLIATTNKIDSDGRDTLESQEKPVGEFLRKDLLQAELVWPLNVEPKFKVLPPLKPLPHQTQAINKVISKFNNSSKGQLIMACGTGKTLTSIKIAERINGKRVLVLVPSLNLIAQAIKDWGRNHKKPFSMCVVCSDETVTKGQDAAVQTTGELGIPVTTKHRKIKTFLKKREAKPKVIFCTYQSLDQIEKIQKKDCPSFDLVIADEAHRCAGLSGGGFGIAVKDNAIKAKKKLFMTATPRTIGDRVRKSAEELGQEVISMCDKSKFGDVFHRLDFSEAIKRKILTDYQVAIIPVSSNKAKQFAVEGRIVKVGNEFKTDARTLASSIGLAKAIQKYNLKKLISFHSSVAKAKGFADENKEGSLFSVVEKLPKDIKGNKSFWTRSIYGQMPVGKRQDYLRELKAMEGNSVGVIANCSCLGEGVDVPALDGVAFIDPKRSRIDIIQAVGRVMRKSENKKIGTIVLPVFIGDNDDPEEILKSSAFEPVWAVIKALKSHDDILSDKLDEFKISLGQEKTRISIPSKIKLHIPKKIHLPSFQKAFSVRTIEVSTTTWDGMIRLLKEYKKKYGHFDPPKKMHKRWEGLFEWVHKVRLARRLNNLTTERIADLDELNFDWKIAGETLLNTKGLLNEGQFKEKSGLTNIPKYRKSGLIKPVGRGMSISGISYFYRPSQIEELKKKLGVTLTNTKGLLNERQFATESNISTIKKYREKGLIKPVGKFITSAGISYFYKPSQIQELRKKLGITLKSTKGLLNEKQFAKEAGFAGIKPYREKGLIKPIGTFVTHAGTHFFYKPSQVEGLRKKLGITLKSTKGLLSEKQFKQKSGLTNIPKYRKRGLIKPVGRGFNFSNYYKPSQVLELRKKLGITLKSTKGLLSEKQFKEKSGLTNIPKYRKSGLIKPVGRGMSISSLSYFYRPSQIEELKKKLGITLKSTRGLLNETQFAKEAGVSGLLKYRKRGLIKPVGKFITNAGISYFYKPVQIAELKKKLGITLKSIKGLLVEKNFAKEVGVSSITPYRKKGLIKPVGTFITTAGKSYFYKPSQVEELKKKLGVTLKKYKRFVE